MIWMILTGLFFVGMIIWSIANSDSIFDFIMPNFIIASLITLAIFLLMMQIASFCGSIGMNMHPEKITYETTSTPIVAFANAHNATGSFFLGSGTISNKTCYIYITCDENGGKRLNEIDAQNALIFDNITDPADARIETTARTYVSLFGLYTDNIYTIYIPEGSICYDFSLNIQGG